MAICTIRAPTTTTGCRSMRNSGPVLKFRHDEDGLQAGAWPEQSLPAQKEENTFYPPTLWWGSGHSLCPNHFTIHHHSLTWAGLQLLIWQTSRSYSVPTKADLNTHWNVNDFWLISQLEVRQGWTLQLYCTVFILPTTIWYKHRIPNKHHFCSSCN